MPEARLYQLHWQNRDNLQETVFVGQCDTTVGDIVAYMQSMANRRAGEMPTGWHPLVCDQDSEHFLWLKKETLTGANEDEQ